MNPDFDIKSVDLSGMEERFSDTALEQAQELFTESVAFRMRKRVPVDEGQLRDSEPLASDYKRGLIIWDAPYAQKVYNADSVRTVKNPDASPQWAEATKAAEIDDIRKDAAAILSHAGKKVF